MKVDYTRRSKDDIYWAEVKRIVDARDKSCRVLRCLTLTEAAFVKKEGKSFIKKLDRAHLFPAGTHPQYTYITGNIYKISHTFHMRLDNYRDLITDEPISHEQRYWWCWRIATGSTEKYNETIEYDLLLINHINEYSKVFNN